MNISELLGELLDAMNASASAEEADMMSQDGTIDRAHAVADYTDAIWRTLDNKGQWRKPQMPEA